MRIVVLGLAVLTLFAGCGEPTAAPAGPAAEQPAAPAKELTWEEQLANPTVLHTYPLQELSAVAPATGTVETDGYRLATAKGPGTYSLMLYLGSMADRPSALGVRIKAKVESGALYFISTYENAPTEYIRFETIAKPGDSETILLPLDKNGNTIVIVANANGDGPSTGMIQSVELVASGARQ